MKSFAAILKYTNPKLVRKPAGKSSSRTANTIKLINANKQLFVQNQDKEARAAELVLANKELLFQNLQENIDKTVLIQGEGEGSYHTCNI